MASLQTNNTTVPCDISSTNMPTQSMLRNNGTFRWDEKKDKILLREVRLVEPYLFKIGSKEAGQKWSEIASALNSHADFRSNPREQRSVRERFNKIFAEFKTKMRNEENASGVAPDELTENEQLLEEIKEIITSNSSNPQKSADQTKASEREKALAMRKKSMESWGKSQRKSEFKIDDEEEEEDDQVFRRRKRRRRSGSDPLDYLQMKRESEAEFKKEEMALLKEKLALEDKKLQIDQAKQAQMQDQLLFQQRQMQQQMEAQTQSQALILAFLQKMNK